jgi:exocyst complex protein 7
MLLDHLFPKSPAKSLASIFNPSLNLFEDVLTSQIATIKKSLAASTFYAFGLYQTLLQHENDWQEVTAELDFDPPVPTLLAETANTLRGTCLRSFPEVLVDIRTSHSSAKGDSSSTADVTYRVRSCVRGALHLSSRISRDRPFNTSRLCPHSRVW